ncbi:hypothetical protein LJD24_24535 (plasmid) [Sinorhizobium meliloti]|nr:hypothetical protein LJD24_24535 [Sinorhizobium meliloti]
MTEEAIELARREIAYCEALLAKGGFNVLSETFRDTAGVKAWDHYPPGDVFDPTSGAQWFYHCHPAEEGQRSTAISTASYGRKARKGRSTISQLWGLTLTGAFCGFSR